MSAQVSSLINYMSTTKYELRKFECSECGQLFIYIVPKGKNKLNCCTCNGLLKKL